MNHLELEIVARSRYSLSSTRSCMDGKMDQRYRPTRKPYSEVGSYVTGKRPSKSNEEGWFIYDRAEEIIIPGAYVDEVKAMHECDLLNVSDRRLVLKNWDRGIQGAIGALDTDPDGYEVLKGLTRTESLRYVELSKFDPTDEFIDLDRKHVIARTGISDL